MEEIINKYINQTDQKNWDDYAHLAAYALKNTICTAHNFSPDHLFFGRKTINPYVINDYDNNNYRKFTRK